MELVHETGFARRSNRGAEEWPPQLTHEKMPGSPFSSPLVQIHVVASPVRTSEYGRKSRPGRFITTSALGVSEISGRAQECAFSNFLLGRRERK